MRERNEGTNEAMSRQNEETEELEKKDRKRKGEKQKASDNGVIKGETNEQAGRNFSKKGTPAAETIFQSSSPGEFFVFFFFFSRASNPHLATNSG